MSRSATGIAAAALALSPTVALPGRAATATVLYSFQGGSDGAGPFGDLVDVAGTLYGITSGGGTGTGAGCPVHLGCGTVYSITQAGTRTVLYSFQGGSDAANPLVGLTNLAGTLYGTTEAGGAMGFGTVFAVTLAGAETVVFSFQGGKDGNDPDHAGLIDVDGMLYGTTAYGGGVQCQNGSCGTVYSVTPAGAETRLYSFRGRMEHGHSPRAGLLNVGGTFYGTTVFGGTSGLGTVYSLTLDGTETVLHSFQGGSDGVSPDSALIYVGGKLYGTTAGGGYANLGTVYSLTLDGTETVLHFFQGNSDGADPTYGVINVGDKLYGTTGFGGGKGTSGACFEGCGTVYALTKSGSETILHAFAGRDGAAPEGGLIEAGGRPLWHHRVRWNWHARTLQRFGVRRGFQVSAVMPSPRWREVKQ